MRDSFGDVDPDEVDIIDFIESDPTAFSAHAEPVDAEPDLSRRRGSRRGLVIAACVLSVVALAATALVWSPWRDDDTSAFPDNAPVELTLTEQLIFGESPAELTLASLGGPTGDDDVFALGDAEGYFFAEEGAQWNFISGQSDGVWAAFFSVSEEFEGDVVDLEVSDGETTGTVQGVPAVIDNRSEDFQAVSFGPVDGRFFSVVTGGMSLAETLGFAEATGIDDGVPTLSNDDIVGTMEPIGNMADYQVAIATMFAALSPFGSQENIVSLHYGEIVLNIGGDERPQYSLASQPTAGDGTLAMLQFLVGGEDGFTVHGQPAIVADQLVQGFETEGQPSFLVAWVEGGRLIVVTGPDGVGETLALAETVRPATDSEWAHVVEVARDSVDPSIPLFPVSEGVTLYETVIPDTGTDVAVAVQIGDGLLTPCVEEQTGNGSSVSCGMFVAVDTLPVLVTTEPASNGRRFVIAIIDRGVGEDAELRITLPDGLIDTFPLTEFSPELPGPAVATLLPEDHLAVELWIGAKVVRTLS